MPVMHPARAEMLDNRAFGPRQLASQFIGAQSTLDAFKSRWRGKPATPSPLEAGGAKGIVVVKSLYEDVLGEALSSTAEINAAADKSVPAAAALQVVSPEMLLLLHQHACYYRMLLVEADNAVLVLLNRMWHEVDKDDLSASEARERYWVASDAASSWQSLLMVHATNVRRITEDAARRAMNAAEATARDCIAEEEEDIRHAIHNDQYRAKKSVAMAAPPALSFTAKEKHPFRVDLPPAVSLALHAEIRDHILHFPAPPRSAPTTPVSAPARPSRLAQYKEDRRYRQDVRYRSAVDTVARIEREPTDVSDASQESSGAVVPAGGGGIGRLVELFSNPPGWEGVVSTLIRTEHGMRVKLQSARYQWVKSLVEMQRAYLEACMLGKPMRALMEEEGIARTVIAKDYFAFQMEFVEALEAIHRREIQRSIAPRAAKAIESKEIVSWLAARRKGNAHKDAEERKGAEEDLRRREQHFLWEKSMLTARLSLGREEQHVRANTVLRAQRKEMGDIAELFDLALPQVLMRVQQREAREWRASTVVTWSRESFEQVYLGEANGRDHIAAEETLESQRLTQREVKAFLLARRQELINMDIMAAMAELDSGALA